MIASRARAGSSNMLRYTLPCKGSCAQTVGNEPGRASFYSCDRLASVLCKCRAHPWAPPLPVGMHAVGL